MKIKSVEFKCDNSKCVHRIMVCEEYDSIKTGEGYPYQKGWTYLYNLEIKVVGKIIKIKDKHFCSSPCQLEYIKDKMMRAEMGVKDEI